MTERESRPSRPRSSASVISASARLHVRIRTPSLWPRAVVSETSLCANLGVKAGGSYLPDKNWSSSPSIGRDPGGRFLG
jgi:hypothetical protein